MKQTNFSINNQRGVAVLIVLFMLFIATIAGVSILFIASKDKFASSESSKIRNVSFAANASLEACQNQLSLQPSVVTAIINKYATDKSYKYLLVSNAANSNTENKVDLGSSGLKYAVEISAYDKVNNILQIRGTGYGVSNEQKAVTAIYRLSGVQTTTASAQSVRYVLYLAGDGKYFDRKLDITGDVYFGKGFEFNGTAAGTAIHGFLKAQKNTSIESVTNATGLTVDSAVYVGTKLKTNSSTTFKSKTGVEGSMIIDNTLTIGGDAWFNDTNSGNQRINMSFKTITHSGKVSMVRVDNKTENNVNATIPDILVKTGLSNTNDSVWKIDTAGLMSKVLELPNNLTTTMLQQMYDTCNASRKINGYMVVYDKWGSIGMNADAAVFNGKVIWIIRYGLNCNGNFPKMGANSRMLLFAGGTASINSFGCPTGGTINGVVFLKDNASLIMSWAGVNTFNGAIHLTSVNNGWQCNSGTGTLLNLVYNETIIKEFETMGMLKRPTQTGGSTPVGTVVLTDFKIRSDLVAVNY